MAGWLLRTIFTIRPKDTDFDRLGVRSAPAQRQGLHAIVEAFRQGYNLTLEDDASGTLEARLAERVPDAAFQGFAHEGVGMALTVLDFFRYRERVERHMRCVEGGHEFLMALGVGFALARLPWVRGGVEDYARRLPAGFDGLVLNGYGFHEGCFRSGGAIERVRVPDFSPDGKRCFDHGLGRAMWFMNGASLDRIADTLTRIDEGRHADLWAGLGTAACYAGRAYPDPGEYKGVVARAKEMAGEKHREPFGLGVVLAAMLQDRAKVETPWVQHASEVVVGVPLPAAARIGSDAWAAAAAAPAVYGRYEQYKSVAERVFAALAASWNRDARTEATPQRAEA